ncbi:MULTISPECIES: hypothetical protein [unclassified Vibrio]|uniref:hypothetical protein n=1 Tax=Vibrio TaxID=662 RepID=UPI001269228F|nr:MULTISPECIES: hypothetical protein [unclassified Vibrio]QFT40107.1 hypothetical protein FIU99_27325 [Vibrio sp. THAF64]QGM37930.1 hypothetical protein GGC04_26920 [Vibrio sp. THAF191d]QGN73489.1 hypothetical protein GGC03_27250 [Vibrio sp. THAF191c]
MALLDLFTPTKPNKLIKEIGDMGDKLFTSDEERKEFYLKMEQLSSASNNVIARTGRAALMWALAMVAVYNWIVRDAIGIFMHVNLPPAALDAGDLLKHIVGIIAGTL